LSVDATQPGPAGASIRRGRALFALALGAFAIGVTEFVIAGVLPEVARSFAVTIPTAGLMVSVYAIGVVIGAPLVTVVLLRFPRKEVLLGLLVLFIAGNVTTAIAPDFAIVLVGRVVAALCHGAFLGIGSIVAADLARPDRRARAIATMFTGLTVANVAGVPLGTLLGEHEGWRATFVAIAALGGCAMVALAVFIPPLAGSPPGGRREELAAFRRPQLWLALAITALGFGAVYAPFTYVAPLAIRVAHFSSGTVPLLLVLFGLGLVIGNPVGARAADRSLLATIAGLLVLLVACLVVLDQVARNKGALAGCLFALGLIGFATVPAFTSRVIGSAGGLRTSVLASSAAVAAFNLGNASGAFFGGRMIAAGHGDASPALIGAAMAGAALALTVVSAYLQRRTGHLDGGPGPTADESSGR